MCDNPYCGGQVVQRPLTSGVIGILCAVYFYIKSRQLGYNDVGLSYDRAIHQGELWRILTGQLSHIDLIHLLFNVSSLWSLGSLEVQRGHADYCQTSLVLLLCSGAIALASYHVLGVVLRREQYLHVTAVGYSCVIFGWMTVGAMSGPSTFSLFGMGKLPAALTPFLSLVITSLLVPRASFIGHLSGIVAGFLVAAHLFDWLTPWWITSLTVWSVLLVVWQAARAGNITVAFLAFPAPADIETGSAGPAPIPALEIR